MAAVGWVLTRRAQCAPDLAPRTRCPAALIYRRREALRCVHTDVIAEVSLLVGDQQRVRWGRISLITLFGMALVSVPFYLADRDPAYGDVPGLTSATLTNIGTSVVLVGIVFFLERGFVKRVTAAAAQSTARMVEERTAALQTKNQELAIELSDLRAKFEGLAADESAQRIAPLRNVATDVSFDSVAEALETANDFGALQGGVVAVPLKSPVDEPELVTFDWRDHELRDPTGRRTGEYAPAIAVNYLATRSPGGGPGLPVVEVLWMPDEPPSRALLKLRNEMIRQGFGAEAKDVTPDVLGHVGQALSDAVSGRTAEAGAWVRGQLVEWLAHGWAVTDEGLISREHGMLARSDFPWDVGQPFPPKFEPPAPDGVPEVFWRFAVERAHGAYGRGGHGYAAFHGDGDAPRPFTTETSPRRKPEWSA